ncbi:MAG: hypothetical protein NVS2B3_13110 [Vulcanimicrobiaceae bacterium]
MPVAPPIDATRPLEATEGARKHAPDERRTRHMTETSTPPGVIALDAVVFIAGVLILGALIVWFARRIFKE